MTLKHWHGIVGSVVVALVTLYLLEMRPGTLEQREKIFSALLAIFIGGIVEMGCLTLIDLRELREARDECRTDGVATQSLIKKLEANNAELLEKIRQRVEYNENLNEVFRYTRPGFTREEMTENWLYLLNRLKQSYRATNYIDSSTIYKTTWGRAALLIQNGKKEADPGLLMSKVFLVDSDNELLDLAEHIEQQRQIKVDINYLPKNAIDKDDSLNSQLGQQIPSVDFGIFDANTVLVWELTGDRKVKGGRVLYGTEHVENHKRFFEALFKKAAEYGRDRFTVVPVPNQSLKALILNVDGWKDDDGKGYTGEFENIDYALRVGTGWLSQFAFENGTIVLAAYHAGTLVGFSLLKGHSQNDKELYVAIHPRHLKRKFGRNLTRETMAHGFGKVGLERIHLKVRLSPEYRIQMYRDLGFKTS